MTDHIPDAGQKVSQAAKAAGWPDWQIDNASPADRDRLARFYAIAYRTGLEHAADEAIDIVARHGGSVEIEAAIRERLRPDHFVDVNKMAQPTQEQGATS